jgi:hypothetical protein
MGLRVRLAVAAAELGLVPTPPENGAGTKTIPKERKNLA